MWFEVSYDERREDRATLAGGHCEGNGKMALTSVAQAETAGAASNVPKGLPRWHLAGWVKVPAQSLPSTPPSWRHFIGAIHAPNRRLTLASS